MCSQDAHRLSQGPGKQRRGAVIELACFFMVVMLGMCAFGVDLGYISTTQTELRRAVDAGALAGAGVLVNGSAATTPVVKQYVQANMVGGRAATDAEQVAETTGGVHFNVPGGQTGSEYEQDLLQIFGQVAASRPLKLVQ